MESVSKEELLRRKIELENQKAKVEHTYYQLLGALALVDVLLNPEGVNKNGESNIS